MSAAVDGVLSPGDRLELADLVHRYAAYVDDLALQQVAGLFLEDGVLVTADPPRDMGPATEHSGRAAIAEAMGQVRALDATLHAITGVVLEAGDDADHATGRISCLAHHVSRRDDAPVDFVWGVVYRDRYAHTPAGWRFARREAHVEFVEARPLKAARTRGERP